jgi:uncharacterized delta-60 repeat protein
MVLVGLLSAVVLAFSPAALADAGSLDISFGTDGRVTTDFGAQNDDAVAVARQFGGLIIVVGVSPGGAGGDGVLARYTRGGMPDPTFDGDGFRTFAGLVPADVAVQPDGKIVVAGDTHSGLAVARFDPDGSPDLSFGDNGLAAYDVPEGAGSEAHGVALQVDGKIVVVGWTDYQSEGGDGLVVRFGSDGTLDSSFGYPLAGFAGTNVLDMGDHSIAYAVSIRPSGRILVVGGGWMEATGWQFGLTRLQANGKTDRSFGHDGTVRTDLGGSDRAFAIAVQSDGKIVAAGKSDADFAVARYTRGGRLDTTFSRNGRQLTDFGGGQNVSYGDAAHGVAIQRNGRIVLAGSVAPPGDALTADFGLARYRANGELDRTFSHNGKQRTRFGSNHEDYGTDVVLQPTGRIVVVGRVTVADDDFDFGLARYRAS